MRTLLRFKILFGWLAVATAGVLIAHFGFAARWTYSIGGAVIVLGAVFLNGLLATWEDEQPGGFNDPAPQQPGRDPDYD